MTENSMQALRDADPRKTRPASMDFTAIRDRIVSSPAVETARQSEPRRWRPAGVRGLAISALSVGALAVAVMFGAFGSLGQPSTQSAYAAVAQAVAKTVELGTSGTIVTGLQAKRSDGKAEVPDPDVPTHDAAAAGLGSTFKWSGDNFELSGPRNLRLVDGELYGLTDDQWWLIGALGSAPAAGGVGSGVDDWLASSKRAYDPERLGELAERLDGLVTESREDGATIYTGKTTVRVIRECFSKGYSADSNDVVGMMLPSNISPDTQIDVQLVVGADGSLSEWTGSYTARGADFIFAPVGTNGSAGYQFPDVDYDFVFTATYKDIGSTSAIEKPVVVE